MDEPDPTKGAAECVAPVGLLLLMLYAWALGIGTCYWICIFRLRVHEPMCMLYSTQEDRQAFCICREAHVAAGLAIGLSPGYVTWMDGKPRRAARSLHQE